MKLTQSKNANINYLAQVINVKEFLPHPNPEVNKLKLVAVGSYRVIVSLDSKPGFYVYFPALSKINPDFLRFCSLYRDTTLNANPEHKGFFEKNGKVTAIKLKGQVSEGFLIEWELFNNWLVDSINKTVEPKENEEFDSVQDDEKSFWVCKKYIPKNSGQGSSNPNKGQRGKQPKGIDKIIENQFRFHYDSVIIKKCPYVVQPTDIVSITSKIHGTSGISAYVLCHKELNWKEKIARWLTKNPFDQYDYLYSSRTVVKNKYYNKQVTAGFYGVDVWKYADDVVRPHLQKGMTAYYEIVGYLPNGQYIQKGYDYGCIPPKSEEDYKSEVNFKVRVYRLTYTNVDGFVHEFSAKEVQQWCFNNGLVPVTELYYGYADLLYPELDSKDPYWCDKFIEAMANDSRFYMEQQSPDCVNNVPHEGIVIKTEKMRSEAWKLKCFSFIQGELKDESVNIEDNA